VKKTKWFNKGEEIIRNNGDESKSKTKKKNNFGVIKFANIRCLELHFVVRTV
jgi:hypothetical protein